MDKYIDRDQFIDWLKTEIKFKDLSDGLGICLVIMKEDFERAIKHMPDSIIKDVAPVKHGRWIQWNVARERFWFCSECKTIGSPVWKRCPVCEAKMDGERKTNATDDADAIQKEDCHERYNKLMDNKTMTNADHIMAMTDEELCDFILDKRENGNCFNNRCYVNDPHKGCDDCTMEWIKQPYKEEKE